MWIFLLGLGCRVDELSQRWQLDRTRILAARSIVDEAPDAILGTRAEGRPGETLRFESLTYSPQETPIAGMLWFACLDDGNPNDGCSVDAGDTGTAEGGADGLGTGGGVIGFEPIVAPRLPIPEDILDDIDDASRSEGISALVNIVAIPEDVMDDLKESDATSEAMKDVDFASLEVAFKRVPMSESLTPNHNPDIVDFVVAGQPLNGEQGFTARVGKTYVIEPLLAEGHIETYVYQTNSGVLEYRSEEPYFSWYTELGADSTEDGARFDQPFSLHPYSKAEWTAPTVPGRILIHVVVRDRRGGMGWRSLTVNVL